MTKSNKWISVILCTVIIFMLMLIFVGGHSTGVKAEIIEPTNGVETTDAIETTTFIEETTQDSTETTYIKETTQNNIVETTQRYGFYKIKGYTYYYLKNGKKAVGFKKIKGKTYYFSSRGRMVKGFKKIKKRKYFFDKKGRMVKGFRKIKKSIYYFNKKGIMQTGFKKIKKNRYYFKKSGKMYCGFMYRKYKKRSILNYFDKKGRLKTGTFKVKKVTYKARKNTGEIYYLNNNVVSICQRPQLPTGCEITSWTMMVQYAGKRMNKITAANIMPRSGNPNYGFMGSPYSSSVHGLVVYPNGFAGITRRYLGNYKNLTGCSYTTIKNQLKKGHLVLVWLNGLNGFCSHTVTLTGYDESYFYYSNPWTGCKERFSYGYFGELWRGNGMRAMSY